MTTARLRLVPTFAFSLALPLLAQRVYTMDDYAAAEKRMGYNLTPLVEGTVSGVSYVPDGRVFYRSGSKYMLADPKTGTKAAAFDTAKLTAALQTAVGGRGRPAAGGPPPAITDFRPDKDGSFALTVRGVEFHCAADASTCAQVRPAQRPTERPAQKPNAEPRAGQSATETGGNAQIATNPRDGTRVATQDGTLQTPTPAGAGRATRSLSPDRTMEVFIRDWNLWVRSVATGEERALTTDGLQDFGYATDNAGWQHSDAPVVLWSPDSKKLATFQQDQRKTGMMYLVPVTNRHPKLEAWRYPLLGDKDVTMIERVVIDVPAATVTRLKMGPDEHRSTLCDDVRCRGGAGWDDVQWAPDGRTLAFVSTSRDHKDEWLRVADTASGEVRTVYHEHVPTYYESGQGRVNWKYLPKSNEFLWYSERSDWGQMYLYDLATGKLKNQITTGEGCVTQVLAVDEAHRVIYFNATAKAPGDPYYTHFYLVGFDGSGQKPLTPENADHAVTPAPDGSTFVDVYSTADMPQIAVLRDSSGNVLAELGRQDISRLKAAGWTAPEPIEVKARDGKTPLFGFLWEPANLDPTKKYPLIDYIYPGPQTGSCGSRSFAAAVRDNAALAQLGFAVVCIDGMGTPLRSKSFHDAQASSPEVMGEATIPDQVAGIRELATRLPWIDLDRVGIWGHSGGGNATVSAMFHYPDFFKVGIAESGNHDQREYEDDWDEKYAGLEVIGPDGQDNYAAQANPQYAANLKGHLLLAHGTMDDNVPPNNTLLVVDALIKANKDFDLLMIPNVHHGYADASQYMMRRRWDYFVRYLAGGTPPVNYEMKSAAEIQRASGGPAEEDGRGATETPNTR